MDNKLGMYHLVFLSHMAFNILEYAKSQLVRTYSAFMRAILDFFFLFVVCCTSQVQILVVLVCVR